MGDVKHLCLVGGSLAGKPKSFYSFLFFPPLVQPKLFSLSSDVTEAG